MGRIRSTLIKRTGTNLVKKHPDKFKADFSHNKKALLDIVEIPSKKLRNVIAGYITHLHRKKE
jgi:small subunit ribosomal protein S17e